MVPGPGEECRRGPEGMRSPPQTPAELDVAPGTLADMPVPRPQGFFFLKGGGVKEGRLGGSSPPPPQWS